MADLAASDLTYTQISKKIGETGSREVVASISFGNGALTYPAGGVPLTKASLGCKNVLESMSIIDMASANGLLYKYDYSNEKLRIYEVDTTGDTDKAMVELDAGVDAPAAATLYVEAKGW